MESKKVGIVTYFKNYNYGSVLQCYSMQQLIKKFGFNPIALEQSEKGISWCVRKYIRLLILGMSCLRYPQRGKNIYKSMNESRRSCTTLPLNTREKYDIFLTKYIISETISFNTLSKSSQDYYCFISGSDQVWSTSGYFLNPYMFLQFASKEKRFSYAASFGSDDCPPWYKNKIKKYLNGYVRLSVRENSGLKIIKSLNLDAKIHVDPALLLTVNEWNNIAKMPKDQDYIFLYFLNSPSETAIKHIKMLVEQYPNLKIVCAPYYFDKLDKSFFNIVHAELSPEEFLGTINNATIICTDSFHGVVFSIIYKKVFYVYMRDYTHGVSQNNRIITLLEHYLLQSQYVNDFNNFCIPDYKKTDLMIAEDQHRSFAYLRDILGGQND